MLDGTLIADQPDPVFQDSGEMIFRALPRVQSR